MEHSRAYGRQSESGNPGLPTFEVPGMPGAQMGMINLNEMMGKAFGKRSKKKRMTVADSHTILIGN